MEEENKDIKVPIKAIIEQSVASNGCKYEEDEFNMLRKYYIACLNLGYIEPQDLSIMVNKFCSKIKFIVTNFNGINNMDYYIIKDNILYINDRIKDNNIDFYEINLYKAVSQIVFNINNDHIGMSNAFCEIAAEKIHNMDVNGTRIILPKTNPEIIDGVTHKLRSGYINYDLIISLLKQLLICNNVNETRIIRDIFIKGYSKVINELIDTDDEKLILTVLDKIFELEVNRKTKGISNQGENQLIDKYQIVVNNMFKQINQNYYAFCALITTDDLREKCMKVLENK